MATATKSKKRTSKQAKPAPSQGGAAEARNCQSDTFEVIDIELIDVSGDNERKEFDQEAIEQLAATIRQHGLIEPIVIRPTSTPRFELIAGERRLRAVKKLGWCEVPAHIVSADATQAAAMRLIENLHRVDLNPIEEATGYQALLSEHGYTQTQLGELLGCSQAKIANAVRMLKLPESWRRRIITGEIPASHSRAVIKYADSPRVLAAIEATFFEEGVNCENVGTREQFSETCDDVALHATEPISYGVAGEACVWSPKLGRMVPPFTPTAEQLEKLELVPMAGNPRVANVVLWRELQDAYEESLAAAEDGCDCAEDGIADIAESEWDGSEPTYNEPMLRHPDEPRANEHGVLDTDVETIEIPFPKSHRCEALIDLARDSRGKWYFGVNARWGSGGFGYAPHWDLEDPIDTRKQAAIAACEALLAGRDGKRHPSDEIGAERYAKVINRFRADVIDKWDDGASEVPANQLADAGKLVQPKATKKAQTSELQGRLREDVKVWRANWLRRLLASRCEESAEFCLRAALLVLYEQRFSYEAGRIALHSVADDTPSNWLDEQCIARWPTPLEVLVDVVPDWLWNRQRDEPGRVLSAEALEALAEAAAIDLGVEWKQNLAGQLTEGFLNLHSQAQLDGLARELGVPLVLDKVNKANLVAALLASDKTREHLPLVIEPVDQSWRHEQAASKPARKRKK